MTVGEVNASTIRDASTSNVIDQVGDDPTNLEADLINFVADLQGKVRDYLPERQLLLQTSHKRKHSISPQMSKWILVKSPSFRKTSMNDDWDTSLSIMLV